MQNFWADFLKMDLKCEDEGVNVHDNVNVHDG